MKTAWELPIAAIVLAAGGSTRMGQPKQLLHFRGKSLLQRALHSALDAGCLPVIVVLGAEAQRMAKELTGVPATIVENQDWQTGMGSSIRAGVAALREHPAAASVDAALITLADQPLIDSAALRKLIDAFAAGNKPIAAAAYGGSVGVPAIFTRTFFDDLANLPPNAGAKALLQQQAPNVLAIPMESAATDIDTPQDFESLQNRNP